MGSSSISGSEAARRTPAKLASNSRLRALFIAFTIKLFLRLRKDGSEPGTFSVGAILVAKLLLKYLGFLPRPNKLHRNQNRNQQKCCEQPSRQRKTQDQQAAEQIHGVAD